MRKYPKFTPPPTVVDRVVDGIFMAMIAGAFVTSPYAGYYLVRGAIKYYFKKSAFNKEVKRLAKQEYVALTKTPDGWLVRLTKKGKKKRR